MAAFSLPDKDWKPLQLVNFHVDLALSPPEIKATIIETVDHYLSTNTGSIKIDYSDAQNTEGHLNVYICRFRDGLCRLHIFGTIKGQEFQAEKEIKDKSSRGLINLNDRIKYVLLQSRNILRIYYLNGNIQSLENHLMAFLLPLD